jgi:hypothetical protein
MSNYLAFLKELEKKHNIVNLDKEFNCYKNNSITSSGLCYSTTVKGNACGNKGKEMYGGYCGVHKNKEEHKSTSPLKSPGKTKKSTPCKNSSKYKGFSHDKQERNKILKLVMGHEYYDLIDKDSDSDSDSDSDVDVDSYVDSDSNSNVDSYE